MGPALLLALAGAPSPVVAASTSQVQAYAFGYNGFGELGNTINDDNEEANPQPVAVTLPQAGGTVTQIAVGELHTLALTTTGELYAFGDNFAGQLGIETNSGTLESNPTPTLVTAPGASGPVSTIAAGGEHSLLLTSGGQVYAFGSNQDGQLGSAVNNSTEKADPTPTIVAFPGATGPVSAIAAGANHSLALTATGQLYAFGDNRFGQLGNATNNATTTPNPTPTPVALPGASGTVTQIAAGSAHSLALTSTGQLFAFGWNSTGQLGSVVNSGTPEPNPTPTLVALPAASGTVTQIAAGGKHSLALTASGQLYAFGDNDDGQLGSETNNGAETANPTPARVELPGAIGSVTHFAAGRKDSLVVTSSGQLYAFGDNRFGQLGSEVNSGAVHANPTPTLVTLPAGATVDTVARGPEARHTMALLTVPVVTNTGLPGAQLSVGSTPQRAKPGPPRLTSVSLTSRRFRVSRLPTAQSARRVSIGTTFRLKLSAAAKLEIALTRTAQGLRVGRTCIAPNARPKPTRSKRCARTLKVGTLTRANEPQGAVSVAFSGRIGRRALAPGVYNAILSASDAGGRSRPVTLVFVIVR